MEGGAFVIFARTIYQSNGNIAICLHTRSIVWDGAVDILVGGGSGGIDPDCRYPLHPDNGVDSDTAKPAEQVTP